MWSQKTWRYEKSPYEAQFWISLNIIVPRYQSYYRASMPTVYPTVKWTSAWRNVILKQWDRDCENSRELARVYLDHDLWFRFRKSRSNCISSTVVHDAGYRALLLHCGDPFGVWRTVDTSLGRTGASILQAVPYQPDGGESHLAFKDLPRAI